MEQQKSLIEIYQNKFVNRYDLYAEQTSTGSYFVQRKPVTPRVIASHIGGAATIGLYAIAPDQTCKWAVLDADQPDGRSKLQQAHRDLEQRGIPSALELSRRGGHLWTFFEPIPPKAARTLIAETVEDLEGIELFPKQDGLSSSHPLGSLVRAPLGIHQLSSERYPFVDPVSLIPVARSIGGQISYLGELLPLTQGQVAQKLAELLQEARTPKVEPPQPLLHQIRLSGPSLVNQVKERIGDPIRFISNYVELDAAGKGRCPFHPPDNHPSFAVDKRTGRWTCFHEYNQQGGHYLSGDFLDFYRKIRGGIPLKDALHELGNY